MRVALRACSDTIEAVARTTAQGANMVPWGVDRRPMPSGRAVGHLAPAQVGPFRRVKATAETVKGGDPVYVTYEGPGAVFVEIGVMDRPEWARDVVVTAAAEMTDAFPTDPRVASRDTEPSYFLHRGAEGAFFAWTRGSTYFSAHAKSGDAALDAFMQAFPF